MGRPVTISSADMHDAKPDPPFMKCCGVVMRSLSSSVHREGSAVGCKPR